MGNNKKNIIKTKADNIKKYPTFKSMGLKPELLKGINNHGLFTKVF